jgi:signal peptidase II
MILGGAIGNLIDRVFFGVIYGYAPLFQGKVVDFVDVDFFDINLFGTIYDRWPIFNVADMAVSIGVILLIFFSRKISTVEEEQNAAGIEDVTSSSAITEAKSKIIENEKFESDTGRELTN